MTWAVYSLSECLSKGSFEALHIKGLSHGSFLTGGFSVRPSHDIRSQSRPRHRTCQGTVTLSLLISPWLPNPKKGWTELFGQTIGNEPCQCSPLPYFALACVSVLFCQFGQTGNVCDKGVLKTVKGVRGFDGIS